MKRYGPLARGVRWLLRHFTRTYRWDVPATDAPVVYVCRHLHMHGPFGLSAAPGAIAGCRHNGVPERIYYSCYQPL